MYLIISRFLRNTGGPSWKEKGTGNHVTPCLPEVHKASSDTVPAPTARKFELDRTQAVKVIAKKKELERSRPRPNCQ